MLDGATVDNSKVITALLNNTLLSIKRVVPINHRIENTTVLKQNFPLQIGILIGITGDVNGRLIFSSDSNTYASIAKIMYGIPLQGEMLLSFSGELGNMIAGALSSNMEINGDHIDITTPSVIQESQTLASFKQALQLSTIFDDVGNMDIYLLLD